MDSVQKGGGVNVFLVKVECCSKDTWNRPSWWTPIHNQYIFFRNCILKTRDNKIILFWCPNFRGRGGLGQEKFEQNPYFHFFF